jgi:hypothetical protein
MPKVSKCPVCGREIEIVPDPNDPAREVGFCNHGAAGYVATCVISQPAEPEKPAKQNKGVLKHDTSHPSE